MQMVNGEIDNYRMEKRYKTKQEHYIWVELNLTCYRNTVDKGIEFFIGIIQDIDDRKKAEGQIIKERDLSDAIINSLPGIFYLQEITGEFIRWNKQFESVSGYTQDEITKLHPLDFFEGNDKEAILKKSMDVYINGSADLEATVVTKSGRKVPFYFTANLIEYEGRPCVIGTGLDITERKIAEDQVLKEKELSESIINSLPGIFYLFDNTGKYLRWNKNHETMPGYTTEEMQTMYPLNFFDEDEKEFIKERIEKVFKEGYAEAEANFMGKNGQKTPYYFNGIAIEYEGRPCLMGVAFDVTRLKKIEQELREAEIKFRTLVEKSQVGVYIVQKGKFTYVNPRFAEIFGYAPAELLDTDPVKMIISEEYQSLARENVRARLEGEIDAVYYEATGKKKDGSLNRVEFYGSRALYGGQPTIIGTMVDITERKKAEEALQKSEANLHTIFDTTDTIYILLNNNFQVMSFNQQAFSFIKGELHQEFKLNTNLISYFPKGRQPELYERMKRVLTGEHINYESSYPQNDGSVNWYYVRMFPITNNEKKIFGMMVATSDITEKKLLEQEIMNRKVQEQKKMTRAVLNAQEKERNKIGQELHDNVNQILVGAKMYLGLIEEEKSGNETLIQQSIALIDNAIDEIRALTRDHVTPQRTIDLKDIIQLLVDNLNKHSLVKTKFAYDTGSIVIKDDLKLNLYRIIQESINNILKHASAKNASFMVKADTEGLHVVIKDDGDGFDTEARKTKGIGLSNILNRVESYNGKMTIKSKPGKGCKIELTIPI
jgi:PAS domain S-box-containing protein